MDAARAELTDVLLEARSLIALPGNNFAWSRWQDADPPLTQIDRLVSLLEWGWVPSRPTIAILFAPTGPMQEVSLSSGWADEFLVLADRFDAAAKAFFWRGPWWRRLLS